MTTTFTSFRSAATFYANVRGCSYDFACGFVKGSIKQGLIEIKPRATKQKRKGATLATSAPRISKFLSL